MKVLLTGCAGFIGSNLAEKLLTYGYKIIGIDNFSTGRKEFVEKCMGQENFSIHNIDLLDLNQIIKISRGIDLVIHLAANADVRFGMDHPTKDIEQNVIVTSNILEAMRKNGIPKIIFSSTGSVYGNSNIIPIKENVEFPVQTSLYATSKIAGEGLITSYVESIGIQAWIYRFVSIIGERYTHGHIFDFVHKIQNDPTKLNILGDGKQRKSYLYIQDCIDGIIHGYNNSDKALNIFNLGFDGYVDVNYSAKLISNRLNANPKFIYSGGNKGWPGDNPFIYLDTSKLINLGWKPKTSIKDGIVKTVDYLVENGWVYEKN